MSAATPSALEREGREREHRSERADHKERERETSVERERREEKERRRGERRKGGHSILRMRKRRDTAKLSLHSGRREKHFPIWKSISDASKPGGVTVGAERKVVSWMLGIFSIWKSIEIQGGIRSRRREEV